MFDVATHQQILATLRESEAHLCDRERSSTELFWGLNGGPRTVLPFARVRCAREYRDKPRTTGTTGCYTADRVEPSLRKAASDERIQFECLGYFVADGEVHEPSQGKVIFNSDPERDVCRLETGRAPPHPARRQSARGNSHWKVQRRLEAHCTGGAPHRSLVTQATAWIFQSRPRNSTASPATRPSRAL